MSQSFSSQADRGLASGCAEKKTVLVTGAGGNIGSYFARHAHDRYRLKLMVRKDKDAEELREYGEIFCAELDQLELLKEGFRGVDTVLHLAADPSPSAVWPDVLQTNIIGTYNVFYAAKHAGCKRVIFASSIHAVSGYPADVQVKTNDPVNPGDIYGVSKCFGEALARYMAEQEGLPSIVIRIGGFQPHEFARSEEGIQMLDAWVSHRDLQQLMELCIDACTLRFAIFNGLSDNRFKRLDISDARTILGYQPMDDLTTLNEQLKGTGIPEKVLAHNLGDPKQESGLKEG